MWYNPFIIWTLKSPFHRFISGAFMLMTYKGRKSGKEYTIPVNYVRDAETFYTISLRERTWWRNLRGGAVVSILIKGESLEATARAFEDQIAIEEQLKTILSIAPSNAKYLEIKIDDQGNPNDQDISKAAKTRVVVETVTNS